jgi:hypothetical protein
MMQIIIQRLDRSQKSIEWTKLGLVSRPSRGSEASKVLIER